MSKTQEPLYHFKHNKFVVKILSLFGIDKAIFYFLLSKGFSFIAGPLTLFLIATRFSPTLQGYYYTMDSLLALSIFFELGLGVVITHFASHEYANLNWTKKNGLSGDEKSLSRLISLSRKSLKWYLVVTSLFVIAILPAGIFFLGVKASGQNINYAWPWGLTIIFFALGTCMIPLSSTLEGCGRVAQIQQVRVMQSVTRTFLVWISILVGLKLFVVSIEFMVTWVVFLVWLLFNFRELLKQIIRQPLLPDVQVSWKTEIFPMQWRVAATSLAVYFTGYLFIPLLFAYQGPIVAGKMGMSLRISGIVFLVSMAWINTRAPYFGALIKNKKYDELDTMAFKSALRALLVGLFLSLVFVFLVIFLNIYFPEYGGRVLSPVMIGILCLVSLIMVANTAIGSYLRAHKEEPLMFLAIVMAFLVASIAFISAKFYSVEVMVALYFSVFLFVSLPVSSYVLLTKRSKWHEKQGI